MKPIVVIVRDKMQKKYHYTRTEPMGKNFDPAFRPALTPKQMLALGVFGGVYMRDCTTEFPKDWFTRAKLAPQHVTKHTKEYNYFGVNASQSLLIWRQKGWMHPDDPRGWFQWYARYYMGRRHPDDARQIKRWKNMQRHVTQIRNHCRAGDVFCRTRQRQALLHWAYDSRK